MMPIASPALKLKLIVSRMDEKELEKMYKFAFEPHYSKKYRTGDPEANKRHLQEP